MEKTLAQAHALLERVLMEAAQNVELALAADGRVLDWNRSATLVLGWRKPEVVGRQLAEVVTDAAAACDLLDGLTRAARHGAAHLDTTWRCKDGAMLPVEVAIRRVAEPDGDDFFLVARPSGTPPPR